MYFTFCGAVWIHPPVGPFGVLGTQVRGGSVAEPTTVAALLRESVDVSLPPMESLHVVGGTAISVADALILDGVNWATSSDAAFDRLSSRVGGLTVDPDW